MNIVDIIIHKRDGKKLSKEEIDYFINGYTEGSIPDYQASALLMAIMINGMDEEETTYLTLSMANSGDTIVLPKLDRPFVDKHSSGGVGDKTTLIVQPILSACGIGVAKMSGRGLGFSGGTIDKLESIPGIRLDYSKMEFIEHIRKYKSVISGQSHDLAPADGKLYALRDVTGTVPSPALMASSIMSKKLAIHTDAILLDVKMGKGAFMKSLDPAIDLAQRMTRIGNNAGWHVKAEITDMNQPLGYAVGNILEVQEAIDFLRGKKPAPDLEEHCISSCAMLLEMTKFADTIDSGKEMARKAVQSGQALSDFRNLIMAQNGDISYIDDPSKFPVAPYIKTVESNVSGYINEIDAEIIGETSVSLGAGRMKKGDAIDHRVGIVVHHKIGDFIAKGEPLFTIHANCQTKMEDAILAVGSAHRVQPEPCNKPPYLYCVID